MNHHEFTKQQKYKYRDIKMRVRYIPTNKLKDKKVIHILHCSLL